MIFSTSYGSVLYFEGMTNWAMLFVCGQLNLERNFNYWDFAKWIGGRFDFKGEFRAGDFLNTVRGTITNLRREMKELSGAERIRNLLFVEDLEAIRRNFIERRDYFIYFNRERARKEAEVFVRNYFRKYFGVEGEFLPVHFVPDFPGALRGAEAEAWIINREDEARDLGIQMGIYFKDWAAKPYSTEALIAHEQTHALLVGDQYVTWLDEGMALLMEGLMWMQLEGREGAVLFSRKVSDLVYNREPDLYYTQYVTFARVVAFLGLQSFGLLRKLVFKGDGRLVELPQRIHRGESVFSIAREFGVRDFLEAPKDFSAFAQALLTFDRYYALSPIAFFIMKNGIARQDVLEKRYGVHRSDFNDAFYELLRGGLAQECNGKVEFIKGDMKYGFLRARSLLS